MGLAIPEDEWQLVLEVCFLRLWFSLWINGARLKKASSSYATSTPKAQVVDVVATDGAPGPYPPYQATKEKPLSRIRGSVTHHRDILKPLLWLRWEGLQAKVALLENSSILKKYPKWYVSVTLKSISQSSNFCFFLDVRFWRSSGSKHGHRQFGGRYRSQPTYWTSMISRIESNVFSNPAVK